MIQNEYRKSNHSYRSVQMPPSQVTMIGRKYVSRIRLNRHDVVIDGSVAPFSFSWLGCTGPSMSSLLFVSIDSLLSSGIPGKTFVLPALILIFFSIVWSVVWSTGVLDTAGMMYGPKPDPLSPSVSSSSSPDPLPLP